MTWMEGRLNVHQARVESKLKLEEFTDLETGLRLIYKEDPAVITGENLLILEEVQPAGKKPMTGKVFLRGARTWVQVELKN